MPTVEQVREALADIQDPELHRSIVELGMVKGIDISNSTVVVDLALTIPGCPLKSYFQEVLPARIKNEFTEITDVQVNLGSMTEEERQNVVGGIRKETVAPFARPDTSTTVIAVGSGKGGVGKSTVTANLAVALAQKGHSVGLLDADVWGFSIPRMMGISSRPTAIDDMLIPLEAYGVKMISTGNLVAEDNPVIWRGPMLHKLLQELLTKVHWDEPEYLLIDLPPGTGDISISLSQFVPGGNFIVVTTPQAAATRVAERACGMAQKVNLQLAGVIENMAYSVCETCGERTYPFGSGGGQELADRFNIPLLGRVPLDPPMRDFADHGKPAVVSLPDSLSAEAFGEVVGRIGEILPPKQKSKPRKTLPLIVNPGAQGA
jgi:ATP-binding protein involved in chromosome partitioning